MFNRVGQRFGNYQLIRLLGEGGYAEVYLAEHVHLSVQAAIKVLHTQLISSDTDGFHAEARTIARLVHPHIVRVLEFGVEDRTPFLVMDYAPYGTLRQRHPRGTRLPLNTVIHYITQIADALQYAHDQKIIHRDVKPENILLESHSDILLSDFGIALVAQSSRYQSTQNMAGTMAYMAPEQIQGKPRPASDQYALGIVTYEWISGELPFQGSLTELVGQHLFAPPPSLQEKLQVISPEIEQIVLMTLAKDPKNRFESVQTFATVLEQAYQTTLSNPFAFSSDTTPSNRSSSATGIVEATPPDYSPHTTHVPTSLTQALEPTNIALELNQFSLSTDKYITPSVRESKLTAETHVPIDEKTLQTVHVKESLPMTLPSSNMTISNRQSSHTGRTYLLVGLTLLIIGASIGLFYVVRTNQVALDNAALANKTTTAFAGTTIAQANDATAFAATSTAQANATSNAFATFVAMNGDPYPPNTGKLVLNDPLKDNSKGYNWKEASFDYGASGGSGYCKFSGGVYDAREIDQAHFNPCIAQNTNFSNFAYEIQLTIIRGDSGGILFRGNVGTYVQDYQFDIDRNGNYVLYAWELGGLNSNISQTLANGFSSAITIGINPTNLIAVVANGSNISLYVNRQLITSVKDSLYSYGQIGVVTGVGSEVLCSNVKVWQL